MSRDVFDIGRSDWEIVLAEDEIHEVWPLISRCLAERSEEVVWFIARPDGTRTWLFELETIWGWRDTYGEPTSTEIAIPLPLTVVFNILQTFDDIVEATLYYNSNDDAYVVRVGDVTQFVDYPRHITRSNIVELYEYFNDTSQQELIAQVTQEHFQKFAHVHVAKPPHVDPDSAVIAPYLTVEFANNTFRATTDWRRAGGPRITTAYPAATLRDFTFSCVGALLGRFFGGEVEEGSLTFSVSEDWDQVFVTYGNSGCCIDIQYEYIMRWVFHIYRALEALDDVEVLSNPGPCMSPTIPFALHDTAMYATIIAGNTDAEDRVRFSALLADTAGDNEPTFREINALNESLVDAKIILQLDAVFAVIDVHPSDRDAMQEAIRQLGAIAARFEGMDALFASYA
jgi:hypothetical protein